jgi:hypothetical protein
LKSAFLDPKVQFIFDLMNQIPSKIVSLNGVLCTKDEPAGKVRVFAMVDI